MIMWWGNVSMVNPVYRQSRCLLFLVTEGVLFVVFYSGLWKLGPGIPSRTMRPASLRPSVKPWSDPAGAKEATHAPRGDGAVAGRWKGRR